MDRVKWWLTNMDTSHGNNIDIMCKFMWFSIENSFDVGFPIIVVYWIPSFGFVCSCCRCCSCCSYFVNILLVLVACNCVSMLLRCVYTRKILFMWIEKTLCMWRVYAYLGQDLKKKIIRVFTNSVIKIEGFFKNAFQKRHESWHFFAKKQVCQQTQI